MTVAHVVGVDPGIVDTGCVRMLFKPGLKVLSVEHKVIPGDDAKAVAEWVFDSSLIYVPTTFVEKYTPRLKMDSDARMVQAEQNLRRELHGALFLPNTGVKRVIPQTLMEVFGVWRWPTVTHHQDLRSAARIALLGMVKEPRLNRVMADVVRDHLEGKPWTVAHE